MHQRKVEELRHVDLLVSRLSGPHGLLRGKGSAKLSELMQR